MATNKDDCTTGSCPVLGDTTDQKPVKSNELPLVGNPNPPQDVVHNDAPNRLELAVRSARTTMQPFLEPFYTAYQKTGDFLAVGAAHTQSAIGNLRANKNSLVNALVISGSGLLGVALARRRGLAKKLLFGSVFFSGALLACYPRETKEKAELVLVMAKNRLPMLQEQLSHLKAKTSETLAKSDDKAKPDSKS